MRQPNSSPFIVGEFHSAGFAKPDNCSNPFVATVRTSARQFMTLLGHKRPFFAVLRDTVLINDMLGCAPAR